jgi:putative ABC transport system permease protein
MSDARRARLRQAIAARWNRDHVADSRALLTVDRIDALAALPHVEAVTPSLSDYGRVTYAGKALEAVLASAPQNDAVLRGQLVAGDGLASASDRTAIVHEYLLYTWGITAEADVRKVLGRTIRVELRSGRSAKVPILTWVTRGRIPVEAPEHKLVDRLVQRLPALLGSMAMTDQERAAAKALLQGLLPEDDPVQDAPLATELTIVGVIRQPARDDPPMGLGNWTDPGTDVFLPPRTAQDFFFRDPGHARSGANQATLRVDHEENVRSVTRQVEALGFRAMSLIDVIDLFRRNVLMITFAVAFVAAVALVVAALGITNTMIMSVLERTREIGVMKAVGARNRHIQLIFLVEGALIGAIGGGLGLVLDWLVSFPGNAIARRLVDQHLIQTGMMRPPHDGSLFAFPPVVTVAAPALACVITTLASFYPARRAVRLNTVTSLRHE